MSSLTPPVFDKDKVLWWITGALFVLFTTAAGTTINSINSRLTAVESNLLIRGERLQAVETQNAETQRRLGQLDAKLDQILRELQQQRRPEPPPKEVRP